METEADVTSDTAQNLKKAREILQGYLQIKEKADPASGCSFSVRRGVSRDNPDCDDDATYRPWYTIELSQYEQALDILIDSARKNVKRWEAILREEIAQSQKILDQE